MPPSDLAERLRGAAEDVVVWESLVQAARARLEMACASPGRVRESAFRLLEADALFTYACEAALDLEDSDDALRRILAATKA
jgi:hypothetical protein